jgi:hypothetical protein
MSNNDIIDVEPKGQAQADSLRTWGWVSYILHLIVAVGPCFRARSPASRCCWWR